MCLPVIGVVACLFLGETSIGRERANRLRDERLGPVPLDQRLRPDAGQPRR
jgi:hypothetical protein